VFQPAFHPRPAEPLQLPHVWRGRELAQARERTVPTGHAALDAHLPGGGWPLGSLVEVLQDQPQRHVWQLMLPALAAVARSAGQPVVLVSPPFEPFLPSLRAQGLPGEQVLWIGADKPPARLWAAEQALRCADVSAVLAWLPVARSEELRRLHLCAQQHERLLVVFRPQQVAGQSSPARLRLLVQGREQMEVTLLKRRGPPLLQPVVLRGTPPRLAALLGARKQRRHPAPVPAPLPEASHALDRIASLHSG